MASDEDTPQQRGHVPHHETDITATRRFLHPENPAMMGPFEAMMYNNIMALAEQNRQTQNMLEQLIAQGGRRARSASASSRASTRVVSEEGNDNQEGEAAATSLTLPVLFAAHKTFLMEQFDRWIEKGNVVRKARGKTARTEVDAGKFLSDHLDEDESTPEELSEAAADMTEGEKTAFFLMISKTYASANPTAKGTKGVSVMVQTPTGPRHPASSFSGHESE